MEVIGGGGKEELCRDLFCFSAPRLLAIGEKQDNGRRAADRGARIILRVSYLSPTRWLYLSPVFLVFVLNQVFVFVACVLFIKHGVEKTLIVSVHVVVERWDPITSIT